MVHVKRLVVRPEGAVMGALAPFGSATIHEAAGRIGAVDPALRAMARGVGLFGPAFTVSCHPGDNLMLHKALAAAEPGDVLVVSVGGHYEGGYFGGLMATSAVARKLGGLAIDGCVRDSAEMTRMGFPVFCRGFCIRGTTKSAPGLVNHPIVFGGVIVNPGDFICGDEDGMVVIPREACGKVLEASRKRGQNEEEKARLLSSGITSMTLNKLDAVMAALGLTEEA